MKKILKILLCSVLFCSNAAEACSLDINTPRCEGGSFGKAINAADYIIVTKLEEYLPDNQGLFKVMMVMRGDIPIGAMVRHEAEPMTPQIESAGDSCSQAILLGELVVFMGDEYTRDGEYYVPKEFRCGGQVGLADMKSTGYDTLQGISNIILQSKKASPGNGEPKKGRAF